MRNAIAILAVIVALVATATLAVLYWPARQMPSATQSAPSQGGSAIPDDTQFAKFEAMAVSACQCARGKDADGIATCFAEFDKATRPFEPNTAVTACAAESAESMCFGMGDGIITPEVAKRIKCIAVYRSSAGICTEAEARAAAAKAPDQAC